MGKGGKCPNCGGRIVVPAPGAQSADGPELESFQLGQHSVRCIRRFNVPARSDKATITVSENGLEMMIATPWLLGTKLWFFHIESGRLVQRISGFSRNFNHSSQIFDGLLRLLPRPGPGDFCRAICGLYQKK